MQCIYILSTRAAVGELTCESSREDKASYRITYLSHGLASQTLLFTQTPSRFDAPCKRLSLTGHVFLPTPNFLLYPNFASLRSITRRWSWDIKGRWVCGKAHVIESLFTCRGGASNREGVCYLRTTDICGFHPFHHFASASFLGLQFLLFSLLLAASSGVIPWRSIKTKFSSSIAFTITSLSLMDV